MNDGLKQRELQLSQRLTRCEVLFAYDQERDRYLDLLGFTVWRIPNSDIEEWPLTRIINHPLSKAPAPTFNEALRRALALNYRPQEERRPASRRRFEEIPTNDPSFYRRLINRVNIME